jgi:hypothetical protein
LPNKVFVILAIAENEEDLMVEVRYNTSHHAGATAEERINNRLRNSGDAPNADAVIQKGESPLRTYTNVYFSGAQASHGADNPGEGSITGEPRGPADREGEVP